MHRPGRSSEFGYLDVPGRFAAIHLLEPAFDRASEQQLHQTFIAQPLLSLQPVFAAVDALEVKLLSGFDVILLPEFDRENDLAFRGNGGFHSGKILFYVPAVSRLRLVVGLCRLADLRPKILRMSSRASRPVVDWTKGQWRAVVQKVNVQPWKATSMAIIKLRSLVIVLVALALAVPGLSSHAAMPWKQGAPEKSGGASKSSGDTGGKKSGSGPQGQPAAEPARPPTMRETMAQVGRIAEELKQLDGRLEHLHKSVAGIDKTRL